MLPYTNCKKINTCNSNVKHNYYKDILLLGQTASDSFVGKNVGKNVGKRHIHLAAEWPPDI